MKDRLERLRTHARLIFDAGVRAVDPAKAINRFVRRINDVIEAGDRRYLLSQFEKIYVVGAGKAAAVMARAVEALLGDRITAGIISTKYDHGLPLEKIQVVEAAHPVPDQAGVKVAHEIAALVSAAGEDDLVLVLISGGGSALLPYPVDGLTLADKQIVTQALLRSGANIREINSLRRHLSKVKGGRLAQLASPARVLSLILSDVIGDALEDIASGPTAPDPTTYADCLEIVQRYSLEQNLPASAIRILQSGARGEIEETPKATSPLFHRVQNLIVGSNPLATQAAKRQAESCGYHTLILSNHVEGESREVAAKHAALIKTILKSNKPTQRPACVISGGETTVTLRGHGLGGRNQEFALAAAIEIDGVQGAVVLSAGTDGTDGPTDAAGAIVDGNTVGRGRSKGIVAAEFLQRNDSYNFLKATGDLLVTGPTFTNVMDLQVMLIA